MIPLGELRLEATMENLRTISYFLQGVGERLQLTEKNLFEIELAVEEATTNIVHHAYHADQHGEMLIKAEVNNDMLYLSLTDWGIPLNPADVKPFDLDAPVETRIKGGMGLHFIHSLTDSVVRKAGTKPGDPNTLTLMKHLERLEPGAQIPSSVRERNAIMSVSQIMATNIELDDLLQRIVNELVSTIDAERGALYLIDEDNNELVSRVLLDESPSDRTEIRVKIGEGVAGYVAATGETLNIEDAYHNPQFHQAYDEATGYKSRSILTMPLRNIDQKIIGVVQLLNKKGEAFTSRDERLLRAMAAQAVISIENARLHKQEMQQRLIRQELETARAIQISFLPQNIPQYQGWDIAAFWSPVRDVSGDFYDFFELADHRLAVSIGDVSGKGIPAALFMALSVTVLRFAMEINFAPAEMLQRANQTIIANQQSKMFLTAFVAYVDLKTGSVDFASAGHNPPVIYRKRLSKCDYLETGGVAMGIFKTADYEGRSARMYNGDMIVLYTDGITEAINDDEEEFDESRLADVIGAHADDSAQEIANAIVRAVTDFAGQQGSFDDETLVVIKRNSE
jgi:sigma-B regulation protein RsbU (phosphoserine phosphatase)